MYINSRGTLHKNTEVTIEHITQLGKYTDTS